MERKLTRKNRNWNVSSPRNGLHSTLSVKKHGANIAEQDILNSSPLLKVPNIAGLIVANRIPFPYSEYENNHDNVNAATSMLNGKDNYATKLWWDKKSK
jgi:hypothetical protein